MSRKQKILIASFMLYLCTASIKLDKSAEMKSAWWVKTIHYLTGRID